MANKNVQLKGMNGDLLFPKTKASVVTNAEGLTLEGVEAGAGRHREVGHRLQGNKVQPVLVYNVNIVISEA